MTSIDTTDLTEHELEKIQAYIGKLKRSRNQTISEQYALFPVLDKLSWEFYNQQQTALWPASELKFNIDVKQFSNGEITPRQKELFKQIVGFFVAADGGIADNVNANSIDCISREESFLFSILEYIENVHNEAYNRFAERVFDPEEYKQVMELANGDSCQNLKMVFIEKYMNCNKDRVLRYVASTCMEGIFFLGLFPIIFYFIHHNLLPGFTHANQLIFRDETLHFEYYMKRVKLMLQAPGMLEKYKDEIIKIVLEAAEIEYQFIQKLLYAPVMEDESDIQEGLTKENLVKYLEMMVDQTLFGFGYQKIYNVHVNLPWMMVATSVGKTNKYDKTVTEYRTRGGDNKKQTLEDCNLGTEKSKSRETNKRPIDF